MSPEKIFKSFPEPPGFDFPSNLQIVEDVLEIFLGKHKGSIFFNHLLFINKLILGIS